MLSKNERLRELESLREALVSDRAQLLRTTASRHRRTKLVKQAVKRIRDLSTALGHAWNELNEVRSASNEHGEIFATIDARTASIEKINRQLITVRAEARIETLLKMQAQINALVKDIDGDDEPSDDEIVS